MNLFCKIAKGSCNINFSEILVSHWGYKWINQTLSPTGTFSQYWYQNSSVTIGKSETNKSHARFSLTEFSTKFKIQVSLTNSYSHLIVDLYSLPHSLTPFQSVIIPIMSSKKHFNTKLLLILHIPLAFTQIVFHHFFLPFGAINFYLDL